MKISSASKKVLASALSAAMVVAFAPTVAFGAAGDAITVTVDLAGGTGAQTDYSWAKQGDTISLGSPTKDGYNLDHWYLDANGDGAQNEGEGNISNPNSVTLPVDSATATYRAVYATPTSAIAYGVSDVVDADENRCIGKLTVTNEATNIVAGKTYTVTVKGPDGTELLKKEYKPADDKSTAAVDATLTVNFADNPLSSDTTQVDAATFLKSGKYTVALSDGASDVDTDEVEVVKVTYKGTYGGREYSFAKFYGQTTNGFTLESGSWLDADGYAVANGKGLSGDVTLTAATATATIADAVYAAADRTVAFAVEDEESTDKASYAVVVKKDGAQVYSTTLSKAASSALSSTPVKFSFNAGYNGAIAQGGATESAGTYSIEVTKAVDGKDDQVTKTKLVLTEVKYDAGEHGSFKKSVTGTDVFTSDAGAYSAAIEHSGDAIEAADGYVLDGTAWQLNGKDYAAANLKAGEVNTLTAKYKAAAEKIATPAVTVAKALKDGSKTVYEYTFAATCATAGAKIKYSTDNANWIDYNSRLEVDVASAGSVYYFKAVYAAGQTDPKFDGHDSDTLTLTANAKAETWKAATSGTTGTGAKFESKVGKTSVKWLAVDSVKAAIESGKASIDALGEYYSDSKAADAAELAAYKALYEAVDAYATEFLGAYASNTPVVVGDKVYVVSEGTLADANGRIAKAEKAVADTKAESLSNSTYTDAIDKIINEVNSTRYNESADYTAADVKAASDVTASLKAATDATAAKAALEAYNALSDAQKKLVATADVTAAQKIVADQEKIDDQDQAAVNYCNSLKKKTVKVAKKTKKTAKKASVKWKKQVSESGNAVTYAKVSGSAKITVSSNGVATLKKGVKKGTYKVKIAASCGNATRNLVTAKFIVK